MLGKIGNVNGHSTLLQNASSLFKLTDLSAAAHDWHIDFGVVEESGKMASWTDQIGGAVLSMNTANHRGFIEDINGFKFLNTIPDPVIKFYTLDGGLTAQPALPALNGTEGYIAFEFLTDQASAGALISLADLACLLPFWSGSPLMYVPKSDIDGFVNAGNSPIVLQSWNILTMNYRSDGVVIRLNGVVIYQTATPRAYNFNRFSLNRRISSAAGGFNNYRRVFAANTGFSDADNALVEGLFAQDLLNAPSQ